MTKASIHRISRTLILVFAIGGIGSLFVVPPNAGLWIVDILLRSYVMFLCTVMAHEASHGQLGRSKRANVWWGRIALLLPMVPAVNFRKTHWVHHKHTNEPGKDPDHWVKPNNLIEVPLRSVALPHYWLLWLHQRGRLTRGDRIEVVLWYVAMFVIYGGVYFVAGPMRLVLGMVPALLIVSLFLWYPFAVKTHEGFSTGTEEQRSHDYYGVWVYWLTLGLSMHRAHHMYPTKSWLELRPFVKKAPFVWWRRMLFPRDIRA